MALTIVEVDGARSTTGQFREAFYDITLDSSYPTGGEAVLPEEVGLLQIYGLEIFGQSLVSGSAPTTAYFFQWDYKNGKLQAFSGTGSGALGDHTHDLIVVGGQAAAGTNTVTAPAATDILGKEEATDALILGADSATKGGVVAASAGSVTATALDEVANATNLSTIIVRVRVVGI